MKDRWVQDAKTTDVSDIWVDKNRIELIKRDNKNEIRT